MYKSREKDTIKHTVCIPLTHEVTQINIKCSNPKYLTHHTILKIKKICLNHSKVRI